MPYSSRIPKIMAEVELGVSAAVRRAGYKFEAEAKKRARYATGYMRGQIRFYPGKTLTGEASWTINEQGGWDFNPGSLSEVGPMEGIIVGGANYTIFNEYGTVYMSAQPMFAPAAEIVRQLFMAEVATVIRRAVG